MKRKKSLILILVMISTFFCSCGASENHNAPENESPEIEENITQPTETTTTSNTTTTPKPTTTTTTTTTTTPKPTTTTTTTKATTTTKNISNQPFIPKSVDYIYSMVVVSDDGLNVRNGPGYDYKILDRMPKNRIVKVFSEEYDEKSGETWAFIDYDGVTGWSTELYLEYYETNLYSNRTDYGNPDIDSMTLEELNKNVQSLNEQLKSIYSKMYIFDYGSDGYGNYSIWLMWNDMKDYYQLDRSLYYDIVNEFCNYCRETKKYLKTAGYPNALTTIWIGTTIIDDDGNPFEAGAITISDGVPDTYDMHTQFKW